jgi:hypothetical protein
MGFRPSNLLHGIADEEWLYPRLFARLGRSGLSVGGVGRKDDVGFAEGLVLHDHKGCQDLACWAEMKHLAG